MSGPEVRETLEKQLQLLSERSFAETQCSLGELAKLSEAMCRLVDYIVAIGPGRG